MRMMSQIILNTSYNYNTQMAEKFRAAVVSARNQKKMVDYNKCNPIDGIADDVVIDGNTFVSILDELLRFREFWMGSVCSLADLKNFYLQLNLKYLYKNNPEHFRFTRLKSKLDYVTEPTHLYYILFDKFEKENEKVYGPNRVYVN